MSNMRSFMKGAFKGAKIDGLRAIGRLGCFCLHALSLLNKRLLSIAKDKPEDGKYMNPKLYLALQDSLVSNKLLEIARKHCKLALEYGEVNTLPERRKAIQGEIQALREAREALISQFVAAEEVALV